MVRKLLLALAIGLAGMAFVGCGGGGGGDDDGGTTAPTTGTSDLTPDTVESTLARVADFVPGCSVSGSAARVAADGTGAFSAFAEAVGSQLNLKRALRTAPYTIPETTIPGSCADNPGSIVMSGEHDNGDTSLSLVFNAFCAENDATGEQVIVDGSVSAFEDGTPSDTGPIVEAVDVDSPGLTVESGGTSVTMTLSGLHYVFGVPDGDPTAENPDVLTLTSLTVTDNTTGEVSQVTNLTIKTYDSGDSTVVIVDSGTMCLPDTGCVDIETETPFVMDADGNVTSGSLLITGSDGNTVTVTADPTKPGAFAVAVNGSELEGTELDCSDASGDAGLLDLFFSAD